MSGTLDRVTGRVRAAEEGEGEGAQRGPQAAGRRARAEAGSAGASRPVHTDWGRGSNRFVTFGMRKINFKNNREICK